MASTATESNQTVDSSKSKKGPTPATGIITPEATPVPEDARNAAERARKAANIENEIKRISKSDSDLSTLGVDETSSPEDRLRALRTVGCFIHYEHSGYGSTKERLEEARKALQSKTPNSQFSAGSLANDNKSFAAPRKTLALSLHMPQPSSTGMARKTLRQKSQMMRMTRMIRMIPRLGWTKTQSPCLPDRSAKFTKKRHHLCRN